MKIISGLTVMISAFFFTALLAGEELGSKPQATKIEGRSWGYRSLHRPYETWKSRAPAKRWTGKLSETISWEQVVRIRVLYQQLHVRDNQQLESLVRTSLTDSQLLNTLPADARVVGYGAELLRLQALVMLKNGESVLVSIGGSGDVVRYPQWTIVETHRKGIGLALQKRKQR